MAISTVIFVVVSFVDERVAQAAASAFAVVVGLTAQPLVEGKI